MHPDISEFSYGYALTEEFIHSPGLPVTAAPLFPSLIEEGKPGGGYDVQIPFAGFPLFLQFKLSHYMKRTTAFEVGAGIMKTPFFRMHLRPKRHSQQHEMLLDLESKGEAVLYAAPQFHTPKQLNDAYLSRSVIDRSIFIRPSEIGPLPDDDDHHVSFRIGHGAYLCSEPKKIRGEGHPRAVLEQDLLADLKKRPRIDGSSESMARLANELMECVENRALLRDFSVGQRSNLRDRSPRLQVAYIARAFLGCEILIVRENSSG